MKQPRTTLITGASSGIGEALALACAEPGAVLHLGGRDPARLHAVASACRDRGAETHPQTLDVRDADAMRAWIQGAGTLDLVIANAGASAGAGQGLGEAAAQVRAIFAVNLGGMLNTVLPALSVMAAQPPDRDRVRGRIASIASIAGFMAIPGAPSYCAAKAAVDRWTIGTAPAAARLGVRLTSVCPGYVRTRMTERNRFPMPGLMDADRAAGIILRGIARDRRRIVFPWWMGLAASLVGLLPPSVSMRLLARGGSKAADPGLL